MHESVLRDFFLGKVGVELLAKDLEGSRLVTSAPGSSPVTTANRIVDMESDFEVSRENLLALCDAFLARRLCADDLKFVGFVLACSDKFTWDGNQDDTLAEIINNWAAPEINYSLTAENIERCRRLLQGTENYPDRTGAEP